MLKLDQILRFQIEKKKIKTKQNKTNKQTKTKNKGKQNIGAFLNDDGATTQYSFERAFEMICFTTVATYGCDGINKVIDIHKPNIFFLKRHN